jgi:hypothetical protein
MPASAIGESMTICCGRQMKFLHGVEFCQSCGKKVVYDGGTQPKKKPSRKKLAKLTKQLLEA